MGQDVVHLPGDPGPFHDLSLGDPELLLAFEPLGPLLKGGRQVAAGTDVHARER